MLELSAQIRRACARWLFTGDLRALCVAEEYSIGPRTADVLALWGEREVRRGVYRKTTTPSWAREPLPWPVTERVGEKVKTIPPEARIVEVKVSRSDYLAGVRKGQISNDVGTTERVSGLGVFADFCYVAAPRELAKWIVERADLPERWGVIEYFENGGVLALKLPKRLTPAHPIAADLDRHAKGMAQSTLWRLYGVGRRAPEELDVPVEASA